MRVAEPFTVESLSPHRAVTWETEQPATEQAGTAEDDADRFMRMVLDNLAKAGVQNGRRKERLEFESVAPYAGRMIQAEGAQRGTDREAAPQRVAVSVGPQYGTVSSEWVKDAAREALRGQGFDMLCVLGFAFDARAAETAEEFRPERPGDFAAFGGAAAGSVARAYRAHERRPGHGRRRAEEDRQRQPVYGLRRA